MDGQRFDTLARALGATGSRRRALGALLGIVLLGESAETDARRQKQQGNERGQRRRQRAKTRKRRKRNTGGGVPGGLPCREAGQSCTGDPAVSCCAGLQCVDRECRPRLGSGRCPIEVCQIGERDARGTCAYTNSPDNQPGPACTAGDRFCCQGACCRAGDVCTPTGCCTPEPRSTTCIGRCDVVTNNCGQQVDCQDCALRSCQIGACNRTTCQYANTQDGSPGPRCPAPFFCCAGDCCREGDVCTPNGCCTPDSPRPCDGHCGVITDNCGRTFNCGECPTAICQTVSCDPRTQTCRYDELPNRSACTTASGQGGICCGGACVAGGACCAASDCPPGDPCRPNVCQNHQCVIVAEPDRTSCTAFNRPGICCGGGCRVSPDPENPPCCATSDCPEKTCQETICSDNVCQYRNLPNGQQGPHCTAPGQFCCGAGHFQPASCCAHGQTCVDVTCVGA